MQVLRLLVMLAVVFLPPVTALAYDVLVLQSLHEKGYNEAINGFKREFHGSLRNIILSDYAEADVTRLTREEHPRLIVAVGDRALELAQKQSNTPVLYMMALNPRPRRMTTGVGMLLDPSRYVSVFDNLKAARVGVVYDPAKSGQYVRRALSHAGRYNIELVMREVRAAKETPAMLESLQGKVDAIWMLPDPTAVSPASTEAYFLFSQRERVPVVTFADVYLSMGGAVALTIDRFDIGRQLGEMAQSILNGTPVEEIPPASPRRVVTKSNEGVVRQLRQNGGAGR
ncbi:MAG TPA: ABC transporter substrate-binding protein [Geobacter sp.]|nr:ABC transporter substrate-binding protein [Geobacter sp.]